MTDQNALEQAKIARISAAVREILLAIGEDPEREGLLRTPERVARMYLDLFNGMTEPASQHLQAVFKEDYDEMVVLKDITVHSMCEHHLMPFFGKAHVGYLPRGRVVGISKIVRVIDVFARRPQVQERLTNQIADFIQSELEPKGVGVVIEATHTCMTVRGVRRPGAVLITSAVRGLFKTNPATRAEALNLLRS